MEQQHRYKLGTHANKPVFLFRLRNSNGMVVELCNYGAIVVGIFVPDRAGTFENVVLGYDRFERYVQSNTPYLGAIIGRYANRIAKASFVLDGIRYRLTPNDFPNHLHGGENGFDKVVWDTLEWGGPDATIVSFRHISADGADGYPGNLQVTVSYELTQTNALTITYRAQTDKPTILNLTHHGYFNLGSMRKTILDHELTVFSDCITPTDSDWIPTGEIKAIAGTEYDFREPRRVGERINEIPFGYNINYVLRKQFDTECSHAACLFDPCSGRTMDVYTTEPGMQLYTADFLNGTQMGRNGIRLEKQIALCLEAQHYPDAPNHAHFPSTVLRPGETYMQTTIYAFSTN